MSLIRWEPFREVEKLFDDQTLFSMTPIFQKSGWDFAVDTYQDKDAMVAKMNLPGMNIDDISISIEDNVLTISGTREDEKEATKKDYYTKEIRRGSFTRSISLPKTIDASKSEAKYANGELTISMPIVGAIEDKSVKIPVTK